MNAVALPIALVVLASVFQGTFGLGMKYMKPLSWEAWWLVHATVAMLLFPLIWALAVVPGLWPCIAASPGDAIGGGVLFGFLWGVGGIMFGISVRYVGMSLTYGIVMGLAALMGALIPLLRKSDVGSNPALPYIIAGIVIMLVGVAIAAYAGIRRDQVQTAEGKQIAGIRQGKAFRVGLAIAITSGVLSALLNVGFDYTEPIGNSAVDMGALTRNSALARWVVVLTGAFVMNAGYALILLIKNHSWDPSKTAGTFRAYKWAVIAGLLWFAALGVYGQAAALMGSLGPVIGWPMLLGLALIVSNVLATWTGEWKGAPGPLKTMLLGVAVLIVACCLLGYSNSLQQPPAEKAALNPAVSGRSVDRPTRLSRLSRPSSSARGVLRPGRGRHST